MFFTPFDCFYLVRVHLFLIFSTFKTVEKVYPSEENVCCSLLLTVFLVRVHFFLYYFSKFKVVKKVYPSEENICFFTPFDCCSRKGTLFLSISQIST